jgi:hypothetical protein
MTMYMLSDRTLNDRAQIVIAGSEGVVATRRV